MRKKLFILILALLPLGLMAQEQETANTQKVKKERSSSKVFTGFTGGMMLHGGYLFSDDPTKIFSNTGLGSIDYVKGLPKSGFCYGLGGALRAHLINHIHLGAEGFVSTMPLMHTGSNVRTAWGGILCDFYANWGKVRPMIGITIGGGNMKRLYVPVDSLVVVPRGTAVTPTGTDTTSTIYNSSYVKTPFFCLDPYIGMEISLSNHMALLIRIDYMLPFNLKNTGLSEAGQAVKWDNFLTPSGPRLYIGVMFGRLKRE